MLYALCALIPATSPHTQQLSSSVIKPPRRPLGIQGLGLDVQPDAPCERLAHRASVLEVDIHS